MYAIRDGEKGLLRIRHLDDSEWSTPAAGEDIGPEGDGSNPAVTAGKTGLTIGYLSPLPSADTKIRSYTTVGFNSAQTVALADNSFSFAAAASDDDDRYIAMADANHHILIWKSEAGASVSTESNDVIAGPPTVAQRGWDIDIVGGELNLAYVDTADEIVVARHDDTTGWDRVDSLLNITSVTRLGLASGGGKVFLKVQREGTGGSEVEVYELTDDDGLESVGSVFSDVSFLQYASLHVDGQGTPLVAWAYGQSGPSADRKLYFARYEDDSWALVGGGYIEFDNGDAQLVSSAVIDDVPHVQFQPWGTTQLKVLHHQQD